MLIKTKDFVKSHDMLFKNKKILKWITYIFGSAIASGKKIVLKFVVFVIFYGFHGQMYLFQASKYTYDKLYLWSQILPHHTWFYDMDGGRNYKFSDKCKTEKLFLSLNGSYQIFDLDIHKQ